MKFTRKQVIHFTLFILGFTIPISLAGCGKRANALASKAVALQTPNSCQAGIATLQSDPNEASLGLLTVQMNPTPATISWETTPGLEAYYNIYSCGSSTTSPCSIFAYVDCADTPGTCEVYAASDTQWNNDLASAGQVTVTQTATSDGHQLVSVSYLNGTQFPGLYAGVVAGTASDNGPLVCGQ